MAKKSRKKIPASFPFFPDDWLGSSKVAVMSLAEQGAYLRLLCHQWNDPTCTLPDDDARLAALSGFGAEWPKHSELMRQAFIPHKTGTRIHNEKLSKKRAESKAFHKRLRKRGEAGARARWEAAEAQRLNASANTQALLEQGDASAIPQAMLGDGPPRSPVPGPLPHPSKVKKEPSLEAEPKDSKAAGFLKLFTDPDTRTSAHEFLGFIESHGRFNGRTEGLMRELWNLYSGMTTDDPKFPADRIFRHAVDEFIKHDGKSTAYMGTVIEKTIMRWRDGQF